MIAITLRFNYPWGDDEDDNVTCGEIDENEVYSCISELSPEELIMAANNAGEPINVDVEVY